LTRTKSRSAWTWTKRTRHTRMGLNRRSKVWSRIPSLKMFFTFPLAVY